MFDEVFLIYLLTRLDGILGLTHFISMLFLMGYLSVGIIMLVSHIGDYTGDGKVFREKTLGLIKKTMFIPIIAVLLSVLIPSKEDVKFIIAGTGLVEIAKSDTAQRLGNKSVQVVEKYLDNLLKEDNKEEKK